MKDDLKHVDGCAQVIFKYDAILYKGLEHPQILVTPWALEPIPRRQTDTWIPAVLDNDLFNTCIGDRLGGQR